MQLTEEQEAIINSIGDIKINAVAGSGKTTTIIEYAATRPAGANILYLAFNKSVKLEAVKKFADKGLTNVKVETAHSLAYRHIVFTNNYRVKAQAYKTHEIAEMLGLQGNGEKHAEYIVANHINRFISYFCNSDKQKVQELNYLDTVQDAKAKTFVKSFYPYIEKQTRLLLAKMDKGEIEITHDFYLKKFQLSKPVLPYDYILFDEGQDASAAMLDVFINQAAVKVIVGDTHQQIYGWRYAVNSLEKTDFATFHLSTSFRFGDAIAALASNILDWKNHLQEHKKVTISGKGNNKALKTKAIIGRTNLGLLLKAIAFVTENKKIQRIYFEGNINSYTYADEGASLYDVLNLQNGKRQMIRDKLISAMNNMAELEEYIKKTDDVQLGMMVEIVKEYGNDIPGIIKSIKDKHVANEDKDKAEIIFSTVHRSKGMEYDMVELVNDFVTEEKVVAQLEEAEEKKNYARLNEEINLLYVAATRAKSRLYVPETMLPDPFTPTTEIQIIKTVDKEEQKRNKKNGNDKPKTYTVEKKREKNAGAYKPWNPTEDEELKNMYYNGDKPDAIAKHFERSRSAIASRIKKLELTEMYIDPEAE